MPLLTNAAPRNLVFLIRKRLSSSFSKYPCFAQMRLSSALFCVVCVSAVTLLPFAPAEASRLPGARVFPSIEKAENTGLSHEPDFAAIERIYRKGQLRSAAARKQLNIDALDVASSTLSDIHVVWDFFYPDYNCPYGKSRHGRVGDGGKWICGARRFLSEPGCVVYSLGSNAETSFETDLALETECEIHVFDPTQASVPMPSTHRSGHENFHTYAIGNPAQNSTWQTKSLEAVMSGFGHSWIDVLKMDIEGGEWEFLDYLLQAGKPIPVGQVCAFESITQKKTKEKTTKKNI